MSDEYAMTPEKVAVSVSLLGSGFPSHLGNCQIYHSPYDIDPAACSARLRVALYEAVAAQAVERAATYIVYEEARLNGEEVSIHSNHNISGPLESVRKHAGDATARFKELFAKEQANAQENP